MRLALRLVKLIWKMKWTKKVKSNLNAAHGTTSRFNFDLPVFLFNEGLSVTSKGVLIFDFTSK